MSNILRKLKELEDLKDDEKIHNLLTNHCEEKV